MLNKEFSNNTHKSLGGWQASYLYLSCPSMSIEKQSDLETLPDANKTRKRKWNVKGKFDIIVFTK